MSNENIYNEDNLKWNTNIEDYISVYKEYNNLILYPKLADLMHEYKKLEHKSKKEYMSILTSWYMREKDALNLADTKDSK